MEEQNNNQNNNQEKNKFSINPLVLFRDLKDFIAMVFAAIRGKFKIQLSTICWALIGAFYFILLLDFLPEAFFTFLGLGDDLLVLVYILNQIRPDIERYRQFRLEQKGANDEKDI